MKNIAPVCLLLLTSCSPGALTALPAADPMPVKLRMTRGDLTIAVPISTQRRLTHGWRSLIDLHIYLSLGGIFGIEPNGSGLRLRIRW